MKWNDFSLSCRSLNLFWSWNTRLFALHPKYSATKNLSFKFFLMWEASLFFSFPFFSFHLSSFLFVAFLFIYFNFFPFHFFSFKLSCRMLHSKITNVEETIKSFLFRKINPELEEFCRLFLNISAQKRKYPQKPAEEMLLILLWAEFSLQIRNIGNLKPSPPDLNVPAKRLFVRWDYSSQSPSGGDSERRWVYLWAAVLASTTPAECIQERTASGSSFMLAVAPRGRLSWIPNISGAPTVQPLLPPYDHENKIIIRRKIREKSSRKKAALQDGQRLDLLLGRRFLHQHRHL